MGMSYILSLIAGISMTVILGTQVAPSMIEQIKAKKVEVQTINNQELIFEGVKRYITMKQANPTNLGQVITAGFLDSSVEYNGFGGTYITTIDDTKGLLKIQTTITDPKVQEMFLKSFKSKFTPKQVGTSNVFETTFVIPMDVMHGSGLFMSGIPVQSTPPDKTKYKFWYDTSTPGKAILKISDGTSWSVVEGLGSSEGGDGTPKGLISMWSGSIASIPEGWALCNGANGTPDLRNRFVIGSSSDVSGVSNTSVTGANTKSGGSKDAIVVAHTHSGTANSGSGGGTFVSNVNLGGVGSYIDNLPGGYAEKKIYQAKASAGAHTHPLTINSTGSSGTNANLPPYYALAFIMKL